MSRAAVCTSSTAVQTYVPEHRVSYCCVSSSAGSIGTSMGSQISHLNSAFFYYLPTSLFRFCFSFLYRRRALFFPFLLFFFGFFLYVRACSHRASTANTAQQDAISSAQSSKPKVVPIRALHRKQADSRPWSACRRAFLQLATFSKRMKKSKSARPTKIYITYKAA